MADGKNRSVPRTVIGPTLTIAWPFSRITNSDSEVREAVAELATLVARLAAQTDTGDRAEIRFIRDAADELATRLSQDR
jgi:hypothetical protein